MKLKRRFYLFATILGLSILMTQFVNCSSPTREGTGFYDTSSSEEPNCENGLSTDSCTVTDARSIDSIEMTVDNYSVVQKIEGDPISFSGRCFLSGYASGLVSFVATINGVVVYDSELAGEYSYCDENGTWSAVDVNWTNPVTFPVGETVNVVFTLTAFPLNNFGGTGVSNDLLAQKTINVIIVEEP